MALLLKRHFSNSLAYYSLKKNYKENPSAVINPSQVTIFSAPCHLDCTFYPYACHKNDTNLYLKCPRKLHVLSGASLGGRATANVLLNDTDHLLFFFCHFPSQLQAVSHVPHMMYCPRAMRPSDHRLKFPKLQGQTNSPFFSAGNLRHFVTLCTVMTV